MNESVHCLIGRVITAVFLADDKEAIKFEFQDGDPIVARCDADCCSHTWVEHIENHEALIGSPVTLAENLDMGKEDENDNDGECIAFYGFKIETAKGTCTIDYRNSSNGYYGGSLEWPSNDGYSHFYGGVFNQNVSKEVWKKVI